MDTVSLKLNDMYALGVKVLVRSGASEENAGHVATALAVAEADGLAEHGLARLPAFASQLRSGKVAGRAVPVVTEGRKAAVRISAKDGFAFPAIALAIEKLQPMVRDCGIAIATIVNSHDAGALGYHVERLAEQGLVGLMFSSAPAAIAPWGGNKPIFGPSPIAFGAPRATGTPMVIDLSLSKVPRSKIMAAAQKGETIPEGWALDKAGRPTGNAKAALEGALLPIGDAKGAALAMMVELLAAGLTGANFGWEAGSFQDDKGTPPRVGQTIIAIDPGATVDVFTGRTFAARIGSLINEVKRQPGTRIPGDRRAEARREARFGGTKIPKALHEQLTILGGG